MDLRKRCNHVARMCHDDTSMVVVACVRRHQHAGAHRGKLDSKIVFWDSQPRLQVKPETPSENN